ncbi:MAG: hypothetical protein HQK53_17745, partial [Oligoflexia bacterium]|nr:hypothetical protein [Oligoflexia bacterium]
MKTFKQIKFSLRYSRYLAIHKWVISFLVFFLQNTFVHNVSAFDAIENNSSKENAWTGNNHVRRNIDIISENEIAKAQEKSISLRTHSWPNHETLLLLKLLGLLMGPLLLVLLGITFFLKRRLNQRI